VLITNYQNESTENSKNTKTKCMQVAKNQIIRHYFLFCGDAASSPKIFAACCGHEKKNSKPMYKPDELSNQRQKQKLPLWGLGWITNWKRKNYPDNLCRLSR